MATMVKADTGTAEVTNGSGQIDINAGPDLVAAGVVVNDIITLKSGVNISQHTIIGFDTTYVEVDQSAWTNEASIEYDITPSWLTATEAQKVYGFLCDEDTGKFSNGDDAPVLL